MWESLLYYYQLSGKKTGPQVIVFQAENTGLGILSLLWYSCYPGSFAVAFAHQMFSCVGTV